MCYFKMAPYCVGEQPLRGGRLNLSHIYRRQPHDHSGGHVIHGGSGAGPALQGQLRAAVSEGCLHARGVGLTLPPVYGGHSAVLPK